jgi:predicted phosphodiesterase
MRIAVLYDIHGNLPALEAVLADVLRDPVDRIVVGGDVALGPMPHLVLRRLRSCGCPVEFVRGNCDVALLDGAAGRPSTLVNESFAPLLRWNADQLTDEERRFLGTWPLTRRLLVPPLGEVLFCHATPRDVNEIFTVETAEDVLLPIMAAAEANVVVCGHTHMPFDRPVGPTRVVNPGSVGMPFGHAGADWLLLGPNVEFRHKDYDTDAAAEQILRSGYPAAEAFVANNLRRQPAVTDMLKLYRSRELRP